MEETTGRKALSDLNKKPPASSLRLPTRTTSSQSTMKDVNVTASDLKRLNLMENSESFQKILFSVFCLCHLVSLSSDTVFKVFKGCCFLITNLLWLWWCKYLFPSNELLRFQIIFDPDRVEWVEGVDVITVRLWVTEICCDERNLVLKMRFSVNETQVKLERKGWDGLDWCQEKRWGGV